MRLKVFEKATNMCGYEIESVTYSDKTMHVNKIEGHIPHMKAKVRWDAFGCCFHTKNNQRLKAFDLPLRSAQEQLKMEEHNHVCR